MATRKTAPTASLTKQHGASAQQRRLTVQCSIIVAIVFLLAITGFLVYILSNVAAATSNDIHHQMGKPTTKTKSPQTTTTTQQQQSLPPIPVLESWKSIQNDKETNQGTFVFRGTTACVESSLDNPLCLVHFPSQSKDMLLACDQTESTRIVPGLNQALCLRTQKGYKPPTQLPPEMQSEAAKNVPNQDRSLILQPLVLPTPKQTQTRRDSAVSIAQETNCALLLLADGHGANGHVSAAAVLGDLPRRILSLLEHAAHDAVHHNEINRWNVPQLLTRAFLECDEQVVVKATPPGSGTTAIVALKIGTTLYVASVGDSTAMVVEWNGGAIQQHEQQQSNFRIVAESIKHKPHLPEERKRIEAKNGHVMIPRRAGDSSRVIIPSTSSDGDTTSDMALAMSRCLGDKEGKIPGWLSAEPAVETIALEHDQQLFVLVSSDGVSDMQPTNRILNQLGISFFGPAVSLGRSMDAVLKTSEQRWALETMDSYRDDMTILASRISPLPTLGVVHERVPSIFAKRLRGNTS